MPECHEHGELLDATRETVVLGVELLDRELARSPQRIAQALEQEDVRRAIRQALLAEAQRLAERQLRGQEITSEDAVRLFRAVGERGGRAMLRSVLSQVEASHEYQQVQRSLRRLERAFRCSPMGVFIDENSTWLYIVAAGLALGGAVALYVTRSGDPVARFSTDMAAQALRSIRIGSLTMGTSGLRFVPSERLVEMRPFVTFSAWERVETTFRLHALFQRDQLQAARGAAELAVPLGRVARLRASAAGGVARVQGPGVSSPLQPVFDLRLAISVEGPPEARRLRVRTEAFLTQDTAQRQAGGSGRIEYDLGNGFYAHVEGSVTHTTPLRSGSRSEFQYSVQSGLSVRFE